MKIAHLPKSNLADTAAVLRAIADEIDSGVYGKVLASCLVLQGDSIETFGTGIGDYYRCLALLEMGKFKMLGGEE
jgi:hypothetical protein